MVNDDSEQTSRRGFLSATAAAGGLLGLGGIVYAQQQRGVATSYLLDGSVAGWQGREPQRISGTVNPTLNLTPGRRYEVTWRNVDGAPHNFAILDTNGQVLLRTEIIGEQGATQTTTFTATGQMASYLCQVHPNSMFGQIALGGGGRATPAQNATPTETPITNVSDLPEDPSTPGPLGESAQQFIAQLAPKERVQSDATGTTYFTLHPPDGVQAKLIYHITLDNINLENVTAAHIHLNQRGGAPVVAPLFTPQKATPGNRSPMAGVNMTVATNVTRTPATPVPRSRARTLTHGLITARDLTGPFEGASLVRLVEAIHDGEVFVQVHTEQSPGGLLRGTIQDVSDIAANAETPA